MMKSLQLFCFHTVLVVRIDVESQKKWIPIKKKMSRSYQGRTMLVKDLKKNFMLIRYLQFLLEIPLRSRSNQG